LRAAADLLAERGYHGVSMADIGGAAGIVGSGVYRHFDSKAAVLVALLDDVMDRLQLSADLAATSQNPVDLVLRDLVGAQVAFAIDDRALLRLYLREAHNLPENDQRRLRRRQRRYLEEWMHVLLELRPQLDDGVARTLVHSAFGSIQSVAAHRSGLPRHQMHELLESVALACLFADDPSTANNETSALT
ncbi:MAG: helix-turn-helix transcriptional regulator, partial [Gordonia polyisoprenivorans]|nr:helix-turn-helix transcriptional regulator [Gordonia polyisoprenivorans]